MPGGWLLESSADSLKLKVLSFSFKFQFQVLSYELGGTICAHSASSVIAVQILGNGRGGDPEFLGRATEEAEPFTLNEGETKAVDVRLSTLVP
jgi:hypothetical protein